MLDKGFFKYSDGLRFTTTLSKGEGYVILKYVTYY